MNNAENILPNLKEFSVQPPGELYHQIVERIYCPEEEKADQLKEFFIELKNLQITPQKSELLFQNIISEVSKNPIDVTVASLKDTRVAPSADFFQKIWLRISEKQTPGKVVPMPRRAIAAAAAIILMVLATWSIINYRSNDVQSKADFTTSSPAGNSLASPIPPPPNKTDSNTKASKNDLTLANKPGIAKNKIIEKKYTTRKSTFTLIQIEDEYIKIRDNDILASFTSFTSANVPFFVFNEQKNENVKLRVDNSTSISISEGMMKMMHKMYGTKRNGKPTNKSKRIKKRIEKWQKADKAYFDIKPGKNPFDPIDLGDLIF